MAYRALHTIYLAGLDKPILAGEQFSASAKVLAELVKDGAAAEFDEDEDILVEELGGLNGRTAEFLYDLAEEAGLVLEVGLDAVAVREIIIASIAARDGGDDLLQGLPPLGDAGDGGMPKLATITVGDQELTVPAGYNAEATGGGWYTVTGPNGYQDKARAGELGELLSALANPEDAPPA